MAYRVLTKEGSGEDQNYFVKARNTDSHDGTLTTLASRYLGAQKIDSCY